MSNLSIEQLENKLTRIQGPSMPGDVEDRVRQRLAAGMSAPTGPWPPLLAAQPAAVWAQVAALVALVAAATAILVGNINTSARATSSLPPVVAGHPGTGSFTATFMVPSIKSGEGAAQPSAPQMIAPPAPPPRHHR